MLAHRVSTNNHRGEILNEKAIIGKKVRMTQIFDENGKVIPVTVVEPDLLCRPEKTAEKEGYASVQLDLRM